MVIPFYCLKSVPIYPMYFTTILKELLFMCRFCFDLWVFGTDVCNKAVSCILFSEYFFAGVAFLQNLLSKESFASMNGIRNRLCANLRQD